MNVQQLIEKLKRYPQNQTVFLEDFATNVVPLGPECFVQTHIVYDSYFDDAFEDCNEEHKLDPGQVRTPAVLITVNR